MAFEIESAITTLVEQYQHLTYTEQFLPEFSEPLFDMPIPVPPHKTGAIILSGHSAIKKAEPYHRHNYFLINYAYRGNYQEIVDGKELLLQEHDIFLSQPFVPHCLLEHPSGDDVILSIRIRKELLLHSLMPVLPKNEALLNFFISPLNKRIDAQYKYLVFRNDPALSLRMHRVFEALIEEYVEMQPGYCTLLDTNLASLLALFSRYYILRQEDCGKSAKAPTLISGILNYIANNCSTATLTQVSDEFHYHPNYISTLLQKETGQTFSEIIRAYRLERACTLLSSSNMPIEEIAVLVGYPHTSNFYRIFKKHYSVSPQQYRTQHHATGSDLIR